MRIFLLGVAMLAGCSSHTAVQVGAGSARPAGSVQVNVGSSGGLARLFGLTILGAGVYEVSRGGHDYTVRSAQRPPEMAPDRKVSEQDCSKPVDWSLGNIRCK